MITSTFRVVACGEPEPYTTSNGTPSQKRQLRLQELGGWNSNENQAQRISNGLVCTLFGNLSLIQFHANDLLVATLRFSAREYQGQWYQDITLVDFAKLNQ